MAFARRPDVWFSCRLPPPSRGGLRDRSRAIAVWARRSPGLVIAMAIGMAACGIVLGWYNYVRFDDLWNLGAPIS